MPSNTGHPVETEPQRVIEGCGNHPWHVPTESTELLRPCFGLLTVVATAVATGVSRSMSPLVNMLRFECGYSFEYTNYLLRRYPSNGTPAVDCLFEHQYFHHFQPCRPLYETSSFEYSSLQGSDSPLYYCYAYTCCHFKWSYDSGRLYFRNSFRFGCGLHWCYLGYWCFIQSNSI